MVRLDHFTTRVLIVIVNYRSSGMVASLLEQIEKQALPDQTAVSIVCADNSESKHETEALKRIQRRSFAELTLLINPDNCGYGTAINRAAETRTFDYIACVNPDVKLEDNAIESLINHAKKNTHQGIWGILTVDVDGQPDHRHAWPEPNLINTIAWSLGLSRFSRRPELQDDYQYRYATGDPRVRQAYSVDSVSGCCMLISSDAWTTLRGFDADFFLYSEEIDLCRRARSAGFQPTVVPTSRLWHRKHTFNETTKRLRVVYQAKLLYMHKHQDVVYNLAYRVSVCLGALSRVLHALLTGKNTSRANAWALIVWDCITLKPKAFVAPPLRKTIRRDDDD